MNTDMEVDEELYVDVSKLNLKEKKDIDEEVSSDEDDDFMAIFLADMYMSPNLDEALKTEEKKVAIKPTISQAVAIKPTFSQDNWSVNNIMEAEQFACQIELPEPEVPQPTSFASDLNTITERMDHIAVKNKEIDHKLFEEMTKYIKKYIRYDQECLESLINDIILQHMPPYLLLKINSNVFAKLVEFARFVKDSETSSRVQA